MQSVHPGINDNNHRIIPEGSNNDNATVYASQDTHHHRNQEQLQDLRTDETLNRAKQQQPDDSVQLVEEEEKE